MKTTFPPELADLPQWVCWRLEPDPKGRDTKVPYNPKTGNKASSTNPDTWTDLDFAARACEQHHYSGLGFMFTKDADIVGVDIDHCIVDGVLNDVAATILAKVPATYMEISPSGTGLHIFLHGMMPDGGSKNSKTGVEMYAHSRYFTMTGTLYGDCPVVVAADDGALAWIHEQYINR